MDYTQAVLGHAIQQMVTGIPQNCAIFDTVRKHYLQINL